MNIKDIKKYESLKDSIYDRAKEICTYIINNDIKIGKDIGNNWSVDSFEVDEKEIDVKIYEYWGYGGYDYHTISIDLELFTSDNWLKMIAEKTEKSNMEFTQRQSEKEEKERLQKIANAKKVLEELENKKD